MRVISICPSNTEILHFLGLTENEVIGIDDYSDWPLEWAHLSRLGPDLSINVEKVKKLDPDLVVASLSVPGMEKNIEQLEQENIPYIVLNPKNVWDIAQDILVCGQAIQLQNKAQEVASSYLQELEMIQTHIPKKSSPARLYWEWWPKPVFTPGKRNWLTDVSRLCGAINVYEDVDQESVQTTWKDVASHHPDKALIVWTGIPTERIKKHLITQRDPWMNYAFSNDKNVHILEEGWFCRPSPRLLTGIKHLAFLLYPDHFTEPSKEDPFASTIVTTC